MKKPVGKAKIYYISTKLFKADNTKTVMEDLRSIKHISQSLGRGLTIAGGGSGSSSDCGVFPIQRKRKEQSNILKKWTQKEQNRENEKHL